MNVGVVGGQLPGGFFPEMGEAPSSSLRSDETDLSEAIATSDQAGTGESAPFFDGVEVDLSPEAEASLGG